MDAVVTARIPVETKRQAGRILERIGSTPTRLINAAYDYLLATGSLPQAPESQAPTLDALSKDERELIRTFLAETTLEAPASFWEELGSRSYKDLLAEGRSAAYEALA